MRGSSLLSLPFILTAATALVGCAEGLEPPSVTEMAEVTTGLTFTFGVQFDKEGFCSPVGTPAANLPSCSSATSALLPIVWPTVQVVLDPFAIDVHEVTNLQYEYCVAAGGCSEPLAGNAQSPDQQEYYGVDRYNDFPIVNVSWEQADAYCKFAGKRLPTEFEWERVAKGPNAANPRIFPTENLTSITACKGSGSGFNTKWCRGDLRMDAVTDTTVDFVTEGSTKVYFLFGNAAEWTSTNYVSDVQCEGDAPCGRAQDCPTYQSCVPPAETCFADQDRSDCPPAVKACMSQVDQCLNESATCPACSGDPSCYFMCAGEQKQSVICDKYTSSLTGDEIEASAVSATKVIRGGSVFLSNDSQTCLYRTTQRDTNLAPTTVQPWLGFRCAKSL